VREQQNGLLDEEQRVPMRCANMREFAAYWICDELIPR